MDKVCFGVDIGGTSIKIGLFKVTIGESMAFDGQLVEKWSFKTRETTYAKDVLKDISDSIKDKMVKLNISAENVIGIGVGVPGPILECGEVLELPNMGEGKFNLKKELSELTGFKVATGNDANIAALGEQWQGSGKGFNDMVLVTLGTGVGGGIIIQNLILAGHNGSAGEIGHMTINTDEEDTCGCGKNGCLEQYASAKGIVKLAEEAMVVDDKASKLRDYNKISAKIVFDLAKEEDELAIEIVDKACSYLGLALANVAQVLDPEAFIIGGGVSNAGDILMDYTKKHYKKYVMDSLKDKEFKIASLGNDAGIYGGARLILISK